MTPVSLPVLSGSSLNWEEAPKPEQTQIPQPNERRQTGWFAWWKPADNMLGSDLPEDEGASEHGADGGIAPGVTVQHVRRKL